MKEYIDRKAVIDMLKDRIDILQRNKERKRGFQTAIINLAFILGNVENLPTINVKDESEE